MRRPPEAASETDEEPPSSGGNSLGQRTVYYENYGCASNKSDIEIMLAVLDGAGYREVDDPTHASVVLVNTCAVKKTTEDRMLERLERLGNKGKPVIVTGCLPRIDLPSIKKALPDYAALIDPASVCRIAEVAERSTRGERCDVEFSDQPQDKSFLPRKRLNRFIEIVPISEGCSGTCAYCCTRFARGRLFPFSPRGIVEHAKRAISEGVVEIQITAQDTASYDVDGLNLGDLLQEVTEIDGEFRARVGMMNPDMASQIVDDLADAYESPKIYKFLHLPVQSGSDRILELMNRRYKVEDFESIIKVFRSRFPTISVATDLIVGFPSENEEDFKETQDLIQKTRPDVINISKYAPRPRTSASKMKQLDSKVITERSRSLAKIASRIILEQNMRMVGSCEEVYPIERSRYGSVFGRTHNYKKTLTGQREAAPKRLKVKISGAHLRYLDCEVLDSSAQSLLSTSRVCD